MTQIVQTQGTLLKLSSFGSIVQSESSQSKLPDSLDSHIFPALNGKLQLGGFVLSKSSNSLSVESRKYMSVSELATRISWQSTSPVSSKSSPRQSCEDIIHEDLKRGNGILSHEVISLKAQVEELTQKSKSLEAELERTSKQLKEVAEVAADEAGKCKSAKEVIKSLTTQLKEMMQRLPEGRDADLSTDPFKHLGRHLSRFHSVKVAALLTKMVTSVHGMPKSMLITHKVMVKQRLLTRHSNNTSAVSLMINLAHGESFCTGQNGIITPLFMRAPT